MEHGHGDMKSDKIPDEKTNRIKDPDDWVTGDEEMTGAQASYLQKLAEEADEPIEPDLTKAEASKKIDQLQAKTGRGRKSSRIRNASGRRTKRHVADHDRRQRGWIDTHENPPSLNRADSRSTGSTEFSGITVNPAALCDTHKIPRRR
jgi:hypothetical protein